MATAAAAAVVPPLMLPGAGGVEAAACASAAPVAAAPAAPAEAAATAPPRIALVRAAACVELELFHDCGCPKARECVCYIYSEGCGKCSECLRNALYTKETGVKGTRVCKSAASN
jgi:hypothetical protein